MDFRAELNEKKIVRDKTIDKSTVHYYQFYPTDDWKLKCVKRRLPCGQHLGIPCVEDIHGAPVTQTIREERYIQPAEL